MEIKNVVVGDLQCNCYIVKINNDVLVIDPGDEFEKIKANIDSSNVLGVLITHHHFDHDGALNDIINYYKCPICDSNNLEEKEYEIGAFKFKVIRTKGHTSDSISYYFYEDKVMFVGDFVFKESIGRCDLPTGNILDMRKSLDIIKKYDDDIVLYPGHGDKTTILYEKENNIYFNNL